MENTKNIFDTWMDAQSQMTKNWVEMNEKLQKNMLGGEMMEKGSELYKEWLENQKNVINNLMGQQETATPVEGNTTAADKTFGADFFRNWLKMQNDAVLNWMDTTRSFYEKALKAQYDTNNNPWANTANMQQNWMNSMFGNMSKAMTEMPKFLNPATVREAYENILKSSEMYTNMYQMWQPFFNNMPATGFDAESMKKMFNPAAYKEMIDKMFGFAPANDLTQLFEQSSKFMSNWFNTTRQFGDSYLNAFGKERDLVEGMLPSGSTYMTEMYKNFYNGFRQSMMPFFRLSAPGKEQEQLDAMVELQEKLVNYSIKQNEMQYMIYMNAGKAWNNVINLLQTRASEGKEYANFQEFYAEWSDINEKIFIELFNTDAFSRVQGELIALGLDIKKGYELQMEAMLEPYPVVLKSQMDEVYRNNYELRKEIRSLQKVVKELKKTVEATTAAEASKTAKTTTAAAKK
ncbi:MAG: hypothetical protein LPK19_11635 [Hymenobacteraceae bacterium]|nr:hypothetical protein [Hymenobacteraceae bacterium]MDX5396880.1 hypothetical protein [Hymenobacteraceae bacterium]MDX5512951.1 hypothetical protein [Hymenobacteraceae bacterium]